MIRLLPRAVVVMPAVFVAFAAVGAPALVSMGGGKSESAGSRPTAAPPVPRPSAAPADSSGAAIAAAPGRSGYREMTRSPLGNAVGVTGGSNGSDADAGRAPFAQANEHRSNPAFSLVRHDGSDFPALVAPRVPTAAGSSPLALGLGGGGGGVPHLAALDPGTIPPVPEPEVWAMLAAGLGLVGWRARRRLTAAETA